MLQKYNIGGSKRNFQCYKNITQEAPKETFNVTKIFQKKLCHFAINNMNEKRKKRKKKPSKKTFEDQPTNLYQIHKVPRRLQEWEDTKKKK